MPSSHPSTPDLTRSLLIGAVVLITIGAFENLAVTTILPVIARDLDGFALYALAAGLPLAFQVVASALGGVLIDAVSFQKPLVAGVLISSVGLTVAGLAPEMWVLAIGRGVAGFGVGLLMVALYAAVGLAIPPLKRPGIFAAFSAAWVVPGMVGPAIAGFLGDAGLWRAVLLGVVPIMLASLIPLRPLITAPHRANPHPGLKNRARKIVPAAILLAVALAVVQTAGAGGRAGMTSGIVALLGIGALLPVLLPRGTFRMVRGVPSAVSARLLINGAVIGMETYLALFLQEGRGWSPSAAGLVLTAGSVSWALGAWVQSKLTEEIARYRWAVRGAFLVALGMLLAAAVVLPPVPTAITPFAWFVAGFGMGITFSSLSVFSLNSTPAPQQGEVSASLQIADGAGAALSIALAGGLISMLGQSDLGFGALFMMLFGAAVLAVLATSRVRNVTGPVPPGTPSKP